jgi:hypothetical protein
VNWVPGGTTRSPWKSYLPIDLARHVGAAQSALWASAALVAVIVASVVAWRRPASSVEVQRPVDRPLDFNTLPTPS